MNPDADLLDHVAKSEVGTIDFSGSYIGIREVELILIALKSRPDGTLIIRNVGRVIDLLELGAYLSSLSAKR